MTKKRRESSALMKEFIKRQVREHILLSADIGNLVLSSFLIFNNQVDELLVGNNVVNAH